MAVVARQALAELLSANADPMLPDAWGARLLGLRPQAGAGASNCNNAHRFAESVRSRCADAESRLFSPVALLRASYGPCRGTALGASMQEELH